MAQLAIKGHPTRGKEVISLLEMLGGKNRYNVDAIRDNCVYFIEDKIIFTLKVSQMRPNQFTIFTLEDFFEKYPYKVRDKVIYEDKRMEITKMVWEEQTNTVAYKLDDKLYCNVIKELQLCKEETMEEIKMDIPKGYKFAGVDDDNQQVVFTKIRSECPKTYEECCEILGKLTEYALCLLPEDESSLIDNFIVLKRCRDAYWRLAGDWKPNKYQKIYNICRNDGEIKKSYDWGCNYLLEFQTEEMRDVFYENFKSLIEECKELL